MSAEKSVELSKKSVEKRDPCSVILLETQKGRGKGSNPIPTRIQTRDSEKHLKDEKLQKEDQKKRTNKKEPSPQVLSLQSAKKTNSGTPWHPWGVEGCRNRQQKNKDWLPLVTWGGA